MSSHVQPGSSSILEIAMILEFSSLEFGARLCPDRFTSRSARTIGSFGALDLCHSSVIFCGKSISKLEVVRWCMQCRSAWDDSCSVPSHIARLRLRSLHCLMSTSTNLDAQSGYCKESLEACCNCTRSCMRRMINNPY